MWWENQAGIKVYLHEVVDQNGNVIFIAENAPTTSRLGVTVQDGLTSGAEASSTSNVPQSPAIYNTQNVQNNLPQSMAEMTQPIEADKQSGPHIDDRSYSDVSSRKVNAFQFDNPELHPYFVEAARAMKQQV